MINNSHAKKSLKTTKIVFGSRGVSEGGCDGDRRLASGAEAAGGSVEMEHSGTASLEKN